MFFSTWSSKCVCVCVCLCVCVCVCVCPVWYVMDNAHCVCVSLCTLACWWGSHRYTHTLTEKYKESCICPHTGVHTHTCTHTHTHTHTPRLALWSHLILAHLANPDSETQRPKMAAVWSSMGVEVTSASALFCFVTHICSNFTFLWAQSSTLYCDNVAHTLWFSLDTWTTCLGSEKG